MDGDKSDVALIEFILSLNCDALIDGCDDGDDDDSRGSKLFRSWHIIRSLSPYSTDSIASDMTNLLEFPI